jgi:hypothetical protein
LAKKCFGTSNAFANSVTPIRVSEFVFTAKYKAARMAYLQVLESILVIRVYPFKRQKTLLNANISYGANIKIDSDMLV